MKNLVTFCLVAALAGPARSQSDSSAGYKAQVVQDVAAMTKQTQVMNDMVFSFGELGFQEIETSRYLTGILEKEGFTIERGITSITNRRKSGNISRCFPRRTSPPSG